MLLLLFVFLLQLHAITKNLNRFCTFSCCRWYWPLPTMAGNHQETLDWRLELLNCASRQARLADRQDGWGEPWLYLLYIYPHWSFAIKRLQAPPTMATTRTTTAAETTKSNKSKWSRVAQCNGCDSFDLSQYMPPHQVPIFFLWLCGTSGVFSLTSSWALQQALW